MLKDKKIHNFGVLLMFYQLFVFFRIPEGKQPRFPKKPVIHQEGDVLVMECELEANPIPEINWYQASKLILDTGRIRMSKKTTGKDMYLLRLEITNPTKEDGGNYRCNACNVFGESNANISLNFQGIYNPKCIVLVQPCTQLCTILYPLFPLQPRMLPVNN